MILTKIAVKQCIDIGTKPRLCVEFIMFLMPVLTLADGLCCAWFIYLILCWFWCPEVGTNSIDWAQLRTFYPKTETGSTLRNVVF
jgi:hypothetical protein